MTRRFIVRPLAEADLDDAARWYEAEHFGLVERFLSDVDRTFSRIAERPLQFPLVASDVRGARYAPNDNRNWRHGVELPWPSDPEPK